MADEGEVPEFKLDGDALPPFANAENKALHTDVKEKETQVQTLEGDIEENTGRIRIMTEHLTNVQREVLNTQSLADSKKKEVDTEEHMDALTKRQVGRLASEMVRLRGVLETYQDRTNSAQNNIFRGNERLDQFKLQMNWNQEELEQWALAARQKEEDELTLEQYRRADDAKIRELTLAQEKLTVENTAKKSKLETEVTETQASQIEMDKTAEQFKQIHADRKRLIDQWEDAVNSMKARDKQLEGLAERYAADLKRKRAKQAKLTERRAFLDAAILENEKVQVQITQTDRQLARIRLDYMSVKDGLSDFKDEVEVLKNQLSAAAHEQVVQKTGLVSLTQRLEDRKLRSQEFERKLAMTQKRLEDEGSATRSAEEQADKADKFYQEMHGNLKTTEKQMKTVKDELFRHAQELYKLRQEEATTLGEISGAQSAIKNLQHQIQRLDVERQRQQELLYAVDFQSQSMQRKVARVSGERTLEEKDELMKRIAANEKEYEEKLALWTILSQQHKKQDSELRHAQRTIVKMDDESHKVKEEMDELQLQNDILQRMMGQTTKEKEEVLVHHDVMKLEVNRLRNKLQAKTEQVFALENRKHQLALSMQEREKEVEVHLDVLRAQYRVAEEERHARAIESAERKQKIYTLKMKYEATVAKTKKADDADHSQAYYVLQAAQVKEELQRKGDELDAKIRKAEREIRALENTLAHLLARNQKYKENFKSADKQQEMQLEEKQLLDSQYRAANEVLFKKKKQLSLLEKELEEDSRRLSQLQHQQHEFVHMRTNAMQTREGTTKEVEHILESCARAEADAKIREEEVQLAGVALGVPEEGFPKTLTEVEMDVRALREHNLNVLGSLAAALEAHPRALETLRHVCDAKQLPVEPRGTLGMATA